jgi:aspartate racemase
VPKHIGIVTVSYEGAALCYQTICMEAAARMGVHRHPEITMHSFALADYMRFASELDWEGVAGLLLASAEKVAGAGADFAICPANTPHEAFRHVEGRSPIPWLHIAEVVAAAARSEHCSKLGILCTRLLMEGKVYPEVLAKHGLQMAIPGAPQRERINGLIFDELVQGVFKESTRDYLRGIVADLARDGCDAAVMACTEIPLILKQEDVAIPMLDSTRLLARAALDEALA